MPEQNNKGEIIHVDTVPGKNDLHYSGDGQFAPKNGDSNDNNKPILNEKKRKKYYTATYKEKNPKNGQAKIFTFNFYEENISPKIQDLLDNMQKKYNINLNEIEKSHGKYNPEKGIFSIDGTSPSSAMESYLFNLKYWEMLSEKDKKFRTQLEEKDKNKDDLFLEKTVENFLLNNKQEVYNLFERFNENYQGVSLEKNENIYVDRKNKIDFYVRVKDKATGKTIKIAIDLKHKSGSMGESLIGQDIDFPIGIKSKKYADASYNYPYALNNYNLITLIDSNGLDKKEFIKQYNPNNPIKLQMGLVNNAKFKKTISKFLKLQGDVLYNKLRNEGNFLSNLYYEDPSVIKKQEYVDLVKDKNNFNKLLMWLSKDYFNSEYMLETKWSVRENKLKTNLVVNFDFLKEKNLLVDNIGQDTDKMINTLFNIQEEE